MQDNLQRDGAGQWMGRAQVATSPLAVLVLAPVEAILVMLREYGPKRR